MMRYPFRKSLSLRVLLGVLALLGYATPGSAVLGVRRRTAFVAYNVGEANARAQQSAAAQQQATAAETAAQSAAAAAQASATAAQQAEAHPAAPRKTPQQKLEELQSLYKQGLISESDYNAAKAKIVAGIAQ
jgi:predicted lipid-binding transport protein (Tim44 family)